jgi:uncharacterized membrane protein YfcA
VLAVAIPAGLLIGLALGALGGGGSILTVPVLVYLLHQSPHAATTASLLIVGVTALAGMSAHHRAGRVRIGQGLVFGLLGVVGSYAGTLLSAGVDANVLLVGFAGLMVVAAVAMLRRLSPGEPSQSAPAPPEDAALVEASGAAVATLARRVTAPATAVRRIDAASAAKVVAAATVVGLLTGFFGVGGGFVIVPALVLVLGFEMPVAVGTSLLVIVVNSAVALVARLGTHPHLDWPLVAVFTVTAIAGSFLGNRVASRVDEGKLTAAFTALLFAVAAYTAARSLPHLL